MSNNIQLFDTHAHIQFPDYPYDPDVTWHEARQAGVTGMLAVGCRLEDSAAAIALARGRVGIWAAVGIHTHEAEEFLANPANMTAFEELLASPTEDKIVAIGEIGLDYFYENSSKSHQKQLLEWQIGLAEKYDLPVIFHVRDAFDDFWPIFDRFSIKKGLIHSFTGVKSDVDEILKRNLYIALNGIMTFTKSSEQLEAAKSIPLERLLIETDAPYLTPKPLRGKICKPEHVKLTAEFLAELREEAFEQFASQTTANARKLFSVK